MAKKEKWFINEDEMDDEQYDIKGLSIGTSYLVKGCAGSGKTVLAMWRAIELMALNKECRVIVYTNALKRFINDALSAHPNAEGLGGQVITYDMWRCRGLFSIDYLVVDEAQDFTQSEIEKLKSHSNVSIALFGDTAQKLYTEKEVMLEGMKKLDDNGKPVKEKTLSIEEISDLLTLPVRVLKFNHRLPKKVARFAQLLVNSPESLESQCKKEGDKKPLIVQCESVDHELDYIIEYIKSRGLQDVGILLPDNASVERVFNYLLKKGVTCELKYNSKNGTENKMTLDFNTDNPKIVTYHSAKGLQFQSVFLPSCNKNNTSIRSQSPLYVACTRTSQELIITYQEELHPFLGRIPVDLYDSQDIRAKKKVA